MWRIILQSSLIVFLISSTTSITDNMEGFESFILAQHWPVTSCMDWKSRSLESACKIPDNATWSIRGLLRPAVGSLNSNCSGNSSLTPRQLESIKDDFETCWPDFIEDKYNQTLWELEWSRHGRCTGRFQESPLEYFSKGCQLWTKYPMEALLASGNVFPGKSYNLAKIHDALKLGSNQIDTLHVVCQKIRGKHYLSEIQVCFSKNLTETSCDGIIHVPSSRGFVGSCPRHGRIRYPNHDELAMFQQSGPPSVAMFQQPGPPSVTKFQHPGSPSVTKFQQPGSPSAKRSQAPKLSNCKPGKTFKGTSSEAMLCIRRLLQRKIIEAKLARERKLKTIAMKNLKYHPQSYPHHICPPPPSTFTYIVFCKRDSSDKSPQMYSQHSIEDSTIGEKRLTRTPFPRILTFSAFPPSVPWCTRTI